MRRKILVLTVILMVTLAACQSAAGSPTTPPSVETGVVGDTPSPTAETAPAATQEAQADQVENPGTANCTVVSRQPTPSPTEQSLVPSVSDSDWTHGPEDANVTIIEYGDFQ